MTLHVNGKGYMRKATTRPENWNWTVDQLFAEQRGGVRAVICAQEIAWAQQYERNLLPEGVTYPAHGEIYMVTSPLETILILHTQQPRNIGNCLALVFWHFITWLSRYRCSETSVVKLTPGIRLRVESEVTRSDQAINVTTAPVDSANFERRFIRYLRRVRPGHSGCSLYMSTADLHAHCSLETTGAVGSQKAIT